MKDAALININEISKCFDPGAVSRGVDYYNQEKVISIDVTEDDVETSLTSKVGGSKDKVYDTYIFLDKEPSGGLDIDGECSCPVGYNCKHVVATLLKAKSEFGVSPILVAPTNSSSQTLPNQALNSWMESFDSNNIEPQNIPKKDHEFIYILKQSGYEKKIEVTLNLSKLLKVGGLGKPKKYSPRTESHQKYLSPIDEEIIVGLHFLNKRTFSFHESSYTLYLSGRQSDKWLSEIINTGRSYWETMTNKPLFKGKEESLSFKWELLPDATQSLNSITSAGKVDIFFLETIWYINKETCAFGQLNSELSANLVKSLMSAPKVEHNNVSIVSAKIQKVAPGEPTLLPLKLPEPVVKINVTPLPILQLDIIKIKRDLNYYEYEIIEGPAAEIFFDYHGKNVPFSLDNRNEYISYAEKGVVYSIKRHFEKEKEHLIALSKEIDLEDAGLSSQNNGAKKLMISSIESEEDFNKFCMTTIPAIEHLGWRIERLHEAFLERIEEVDVEWYSELDDESQYDYFGLSMGVKFHGEKVNILPVIAKLIRSTTPEVIRNTPDENNIPIPLPGGKILQAPFSRIKPIINILIELYDTELNPKGGVNLSKRQAALLYEIEKAFKSSKMRWMGGENLRKLGKKLSSFKSIKKVVPPKLFGTKLRPYQQEGVNWMQFLREYHLSGILADDMGLGKTVQTLAHLSIEKNKGRMKRPSLIVAPTSLMVNWRLEAERFSSNLKVLVYHGDSRKKYDSSISDYNLVLTTYPLLVRDKEMLLNNEFYYLILDEAQFIKNSKAKGTQVVQQIKAEHRLCLTGTPMENHLGELWSLFHFLMPGLLGTDRQFKKIFRTPIEKHNDTERRKGLSVRLKPFMLRRLKNEVVKELPDKTEIVRKVRLEGPQRDLYESIRLSMEKKVRDAINKQGLARSHIIVLDALLKLRQTCCDPRLLKLSSAKKAHKHSAKMVLLMEMLPEMVEEGRKILLFSQFTGMLNIIEGALSEKGIKYAKLTGSTKNRERPIQSFQEGDIPVFLISLKAGGTGLNLTAADVVIHYDPWWNPAVEDQATDRAHRIGQKKSVFVYKLQVEGTVEETIQLMQQKKRSLMTGLFSEKTGQKLKLSSKDLDSLFKPIDNNL